MDEKVIARFWSRVDKSGECWEWQGARNPSGHGVFAISKKRLMLAHRFSWLISTGTMPKACVLHRCDNAPCVNPAHLFEGSRADNMHDMWSKGRGSPPPRFRGANHPATPLTAEDVLFIRWAHGRGHSGSALARMFAISATAASNIVNGKTWAHL